VTNCAGAGALAGGGIRGLNTSKANNALTLTYNIYY